MNNPFLLIDNAILCLSEDNQDRLWIGTHQGCNRLDTRDLHIEAFEDDAFQGTRINSLAFDGKDNMWVGTDRGLFRYCLSDQNLHHYTYDPYDKKTVSGTAINYIYKDPEGNIWILCWESGLCRYVPEKDNFVRYPSIGQANNPFRLYQDRDKTYWIGTWGEGCFRFNPETTDKEQLFQPVPVLGPGSRTPESVIFSIVQDDKYGYLWFMSMTGLYVMAKQPDGSLQPVDISSYLSGSNRLYSEIVKDRDGNLWIGAFSEGVIYINFDRPPVSNYTLDVIRQRMGFLPSIKALSVDEDGLVWLGLNRYGLCLYDRVNNKASMYTDYPSLKTLRGIETINFIREIKSRKEHWIGTNDNQIYVFRKEQSGIEWVRTINMGNRLVTSGDKIIYEDRSGLVWIGMDGGLVMVTPLNEVKVVAEIPYVSDITQDADGYLWVSSEKMGLFELIPHQKSYQLVHFDKYAKGLNTNIYQSVCAHPSGKLWIGTKEGVSLSMTKRYIVSTM
jgi:ligand-binding sensor domain-containing protein